MNRLCTFVAACAITLGLLFGGATVFAQEPPHPTPEGTPQQNDGADPGDSRASAFRAVSGPSVEQVPGGALLVSAYGIVWLLLLGYVYRLGALHKRTMHDLERVEKSIADARVKTNDTKS